MTAPPGPQVRVTWYLAEEEHQGGAEALVVTCPLTTDVKYKRQERENTRTWNGRGRRGTDANFISTVFHLPSYSGVIAAGVTWSLVGRKFAENGENFSNFETCSGTSGYYFCAYVE